MAHTARGKTTEPNKLLSADRPAHDWYRFVLSFPPHLVREYLQRFKIGREQVVLDPFCGTGTTLVECKKLGIPSVGVEANPMACFASRAKTDWSISSKNFVRKARAVADQAIDELRRQGFEDEPLPFFRNGHANAAPANVTRLRNLAPECQRLLLTRSISPIPLHKTLVLLEHIQTEMIEGRSQALLALAKALVFSISNLHFGPEVGLGSIKQDTPVVGTWLSHVEAMAADLRSLERAAVVPSTVHLADARNISHVLPPESVDAVITSPPYPNEKDYTRTTRLESVLLGLVQTKTELRDLKKQLVRSNTRGVYRSDSDDKFVERHAGIQRIARAIESRRIELGKTSGFERMYHRVAKLYFGGMARHLAELRKVLKPGAYLAYVVGDQASYLRIMIRTGKLLAEIAESLGYQVIQIDLFRKRLATATKEQLREEVVVLRWPGHPSLR
jgi:DNA modification methylase